MSAEKNVWSSSEDAQNIVRQAEALRAEYLTELARNAWDSISAFCSGILTGFRAGRTMRELYALSDRDLADIGLSREDIPTVSIELAEGRSTTSYASDTTVPEVKKPGNANVRDASRKTSAAAINKEAA